MKSVFMYGIRGGECDVVLGMRPDHEASMQFIRGYPTVEYIAESQYFFVERWELEDTIPAPKEYWLYDVVYDPDDEAAYFETDKIPQQYKLVETNHITRIEKPSSATV